MCCLLVAGRVPESSEVVLRSVLVLGDSLLGCFAQRHVKGLLLRTRAIACCMGAIGHAMIARIALRHVILVYAFTLYQQHKSVDIESYHLANHIA